MLCNVLQVYYNIVAPISSVLYRYRPIYYGPKMSERHMGTLTVRSLKLEESYGVHYISWFQGPSTCLSDACDFVLGVTRVMITSSLVEPSTKKKIPLSLHKQITRLLDPG